MGSARNATKNRRDSKKPPFIESMACPMCTASMAPRLGKFGWFYGCTRFPDCRGIVNVREVSNRGDIIDPDSIRERNAAIAQRRVDRRAADNHRVDNGVAAWRARMIAADTTTDPPFDAVQLHGEIYAAFGPVGGPLVPCDSMDMIEEADAMDAEFASMFR